VWAAALSCWNQKSSESSNSSNLGRRKFSNISQYRLEVTVTVSPRSSKKVTIHLNGTQRTRQWLEACAEVFGEGHGGSSLPNTENFACSQYRTDGNAPHRCTTKQLWEERVEEYPQIKFYRFPSLLHLIPVQQEFLDGCILRSAWRTRLTVRSEIPKAVACFQAERLGDCSIDARTRTFSGVLMLRGWPLGFLGNADPLALTYETHRWILFQSGTASVA